MRFCQIKMKDGTSAVIDLDKIVAITVRRKEPAPDHDIWMADTLRITVTDDEAESIERKLLK